MAWNDFESGFCAASRIRVLLSEFSGPIVLMPLCLQSIYLLLARRESLCTLIVWVRPLRAHVHVHAHVRARAARSHVMHVMYSEAGLEDGVHVHVRGAFVASVSSAYSHGRHHSESSHVQK